MPNNIYLFITRARIVCVLVVFVIALLYASVLSITPASISQAQDTMQLDSFAQKSKTSQVEKDKSAKEAKRLFIQARDRIADEDWAEAEKSFNQFLRDYPQAGNTDAALYWLAFTRTKQSKHREADESIARLMREFPKSSWANDARALRIEIAAQIGDRRTIERAADETKVGDEELKLVALQSLFGANTARAVRIAADLLKADSTASTQVKETALMLLGTNANGNDEALTLLTNAARSSGDNRLRRAAIMGLGMADDERSFTLLRELAASSTNSDAANTAVIAISQSHNPQAPRLLLEIGRTSSSTNVRQTAILMLGQSGGDEAVTELLKLYDATRDVETKKAVVLALSQSGNARGVARLGEIVRKESDTDVRGHAVIMLSQTHDASAIETLVAVYDAETNLSVKEHVITALAQANDKRALSKLIDIARRDASVEMRKRAIFWLGQSDDPEAQKTLKEILK